jgi:hypothetical protein
MSADTDNPNLNQLPACGHLSDPTIAEIDAEQVDHIFIVKAFADGLPWVETLNRPVPTQMAVKPGVIVLGLVLDALTGQSPLYRLEECYEGRDTELLLGERIPAGAFNDNAVGENAFISIADSARVSCSSLS